MKDDISINEFKLGMMLIDKNNKKYVVHIEKRYVFG